MNTTSLHEAVKDFFIRYREGIGYGTYYFHKENDNFKVLISSEGQVYQLNTDHEPWGIELQTLDDLKVRFKSFTGEVLEDVSDRWNTTN